MLLEHLLRLSWVCLLLFSSGSGFPYQVKVPQGVKGPDSGLGQFYGGAGQGYYYDPSTGQYYFGGGKGGSGSDGGGSVSGGSGPKPKYFYYGVGPGSSGSGSGGSGGSGSSSSGGSGSAGSSSGGSGSGSGSSGSSGSGGAGGSGLPFYVVDPSGFDLSDLKLPLFPFPNHWLYPDVPSGSIPAFLQPPLVRLIQSSNDYQRARSLVAHTKYTQDDWDILPYVGGQDGDQDQDGQGPGDGPGGSGSQGVKW